MRPLADIRIVAVEQYGAGPWATIQLADLGAEIIKVEDPRTGGDVGRYVPPFQEGSDSLFFQTFNRNKKSVALDLLNPSGRDTFERLASVSDAVFSNLRGDVPKRLRLTYEDLCNVNPQIVCCSLSAYGMTGPRAADPGYDYILQGIAGWMSVTGEPNGPPVKTGLSLVDYSGGYVAAISLLAAIHEARRTGKGMNCDVSLFDTAVSLLTYVGAWTLTGAYQPARTRMSSHPSLFPFGVFETADGWIVVACAKEKFWIRLIGAMGLDAVTADPRFRDFKGRMVYIEALRPILEDAFRREGTDHWVRTLHDAGVPVGPVNDIEGALADPQTEARNLIRSVQHPDLGEIRVPGTAVRAGDSEPEPRPAPAYDADRHDLLRGVLELSDQEIEELAAAGAFGSNQ
jgi:crotonobetainyl-CoA:carnitine CoA-transferase CaiB-like acyl-CoA transferase